jgi:hypothetical protein
MKIIMAHGKTVFHGIPNDCHLYKGDSGLGSAVKNHWAKWKWYRPDADFAMITKLVPKTKTAYLLPFC